MARTGSGWSGTAACSSYTQFYKRTKFKDQIDALISAAVLRTGMPCGLLDVETCKTRELPARSTRWRLGPEVGPSGRRTARRWS